MKKKYIISGIVIVLISAGIWYGVSGSSEPTTLEKETFSKAFSGTMESSIKVTGKTNLVNEQKLKFTQIGTVKSVLVTNGQLVKKWDLLAEIDKTEVNNELKEAQIRFDSAKTALDKAKDKNKNTDQVKALMDIESLSVKLSTAEKELSLLRVELDNSLSDKERSSSESRTEYENNLRDLKLNKENIDREYTLKKKELSDKKASLATEDWNLTQSIDTETRALVSKTSAYYREKENAYNAIRSDLSDVEQALRTLNNTLFVDREYSSKTQNYLYSAKNTKYRSESENQYFWVKRLLADLGTAFASLDRKNLDIAKLTPVMEKEKAVYDALADAADATAFGLDNSIPSGDFDEWAISSQKSSATSLRNGAYTKVTSLTDAINKLRDLESPEVLKKNSDLAIQKKKDENANLRLDIEKLDREVSLLAANLTTKKNQLDIALAKSSSSVTSAGLALERARIERESNIKSKQLELRTLEQDLTLAKKRYAELAKSDEVTAADNALKQAQIAIDQVKRKIENYELRAPFDGTVNKVDLKVGDNLSANNESYIYLINPNLVEITINLDQIDIMKVKAGQSAKIVLDSQPDVTYSGSLGDIDGKPVDDNGSIKYQVKILLDKKEKSIYSGMTANVEIVTAEKQNVILVPSMSVETDAEKGTQYVTLRKNGQKIKQEITIGDTGNGNTEVLSGVTIGDEVLEVNFDANKFKPEDFNGGMGF